MSESIHSPGTPRWVLDRLQSFTGSFLLMLVGFGVFTLPAILVAMFSSIDLSYTIISLLGLTVAASAFMVRNEIHDQAFSIDFTQASQIELIYFAVSLYILVGSMISGLIAFSAALATYFDAQGAQVLALLVAIALPDLDSRLSRKFNFGLGELFLLIAIQVLQVAGRIYNIQNNILKSAEQNARGFTNRSH